MLLMSSFSVFDSKGGEVVGPKASSTHNNTKSIDFKFLEDTMIQVVTFNWCQSTCGFGYGMLRRLKGRALFGNGLRKEGKWIMELGEA